MSKILFLLSSQKALTETETETASDFQALHRKTLEFRAPTSSAQGQSRTYLKQTRGNCVTKARGKRGYASRRQLKPWKDLYLKTYSKKHVRGRHSKMFFLPVTGILGGFSVIHA